jgi:hypothetical protein
MVGKFAMPIKGDMEQVALACRADLRRRLLQTCHRSKQSSLHTLRGCLAAHKVLGYA